MDIYGYFPVQSLIVCDVKEKKTKNWKKQYNLSLINR